MNLIFSPADLAAMRQVKEAFDPLGLCNPGKIFPPPASPSLISQSPRELSPDKDFPSSLKELLGSENCLLTEPERKKYEVDGIIPQVVAFPKGEQEVVAILGLAAAKKASIVPWGMGTKSAYGHPPSRVDCVLSLSRLNRILEVDLDNLTITAEAGARLETLQEKLALDRCFIPLDPPLADATLGGILATNSTGPKRFLYGSPRDVTLGIKVASSGGDFVKAGGKTVKNVSGYDMTKLYLGSFGTLGIITETTLRLYPLPEKEAVVLLPCPEISKARALASQIIHSDLIPSAIILLNQKASAAFLHGINSPSAASYWLLIGIEGALEAVKAQKQRLQSLRAKEGLESFFLLPDSQVKETWKRFKGYREWFSRQAELMVSCKAATPLSQGIELIKKVEELSARHNVETAVFGHLGLGILNLFFSAEETTLQALSKIREIMAILRQEAQNQGGYLMVEFAPPEFKKDFSVWGEAGPAFPYMKALKKALDPLNLLNPNRFFGGL